ncbi:hypothetical protein EYC84_005366 [Monilinia fructicola]|uniref:Uncharacterized protein n=1 Tax=Monilinia fructicola TaxID=38448 RepID=A0A5M9JYS8_MONFR|nr:hypothetical protein EYC84_005366 [Monilinia fructicola]
MSTYANRNSYVGPEDQRNIYKAGIDIYEPVTEISGTITPLTVLSPEVIEIRMRDGIQKSRRNTITMKNNHGEDMEMSLAFGIMRDGPPSTDDEESEEEGAHMAMTKKSHFGNPILSDHG